MALLEWFPDSTEKAETYVLLEQNFAMTKHAYLQRESDYLWRVKLPVTYGNGFTAYLTAATIRTRNAVDAQLQVLRIVRGE